MVTVRWRVLLASCYGLCVAVSSALLLDAAAAHPRIPASVLSGLALPASFLVRRLVPGSAGAYLLGFAESPLGSVVGVFLLFLLAFLAAAAAAVPLRRLRRN